MKNTGHALLYVVRSDLCLTGCAIEIKHFFLDLLRISMLSCTGDTKQAKEYHMPHTVLTILEGAAGLACLAVILWLNSRIPKR